MVFRFPMKTPFEKQVRNFRSSFSDFFFLDSYDIEKKNELLMN